MNPMTPAYGIWLMVAWYRQLRGLYHLRASMTAQGSVMVVVAVMALGSGVLLPTSNVVMAEKAGSAVVAAVGYQAAAGNLGQAAGSAAIGLLFIANPRASFTVISAATFSAAVAAWILARRRGARLSER